MSTSSINSLLPSRISPSTFLFLPVAALSTYILYSSASTALSSKPIPSPLETHLPNVSEFEVSKWAYPPDAMPGARDVDSPYGTIRVYEWGSEDGEKVLLVHGISTPSIALANLAHYLVEKGKRVMLFDLFGRGFSSAPAPPAPYNPQLYTSQMLLALHSSPLHWRRFSLIGYSLGGCIATNFASYFPSHVTSVIGLAPGGLLRPSERSWWLQVLYSNLAQAIMGDIGRRWLLRRRLWTDEVADSSQHQVEASVNPSASTAISGNPESSTSMTVDAAKDNQTFVPFSPYQCSLAVNFSLLHHRGFAFAFIDSLKSAPIYAQQERWRRIQCPILLILGRTDPIIKLGPTTEDFEACVEEGKRKVVVLEAGHDVAVSRWRECGEACEVFWEEFGGKA